jgi:hypothetical protein
MALGQFDKTGDITKTPPTSAASTREITVGGPLNLDPEEHRLPAVIHVMVVQIPTETQGPADPETPKPPEDHEHDHEKAKIESGVLEIKEAPEDGKWKLTLTVRAADFDPGEARGIAVAVVPNKKLFAYETLTWCENITLT